MTTFESDFYAMAAGHNVDKDSLIKMTTWFTAIKGGWVPHPPLSIVGGDLEVTRYGNLSARIEVTAGSIAQIRQFYADLFSVTDYPTPQAVTIRLRDVERRERFFNGYLQPPLAGRDFQRVHQPGENKFIALSLRIDLTEATADDTLARFELLGNSTIVAPVGSTYAALEPGFVALDYQQGGDVSDQVVLIFVSTPQAGTTSNMIAGTYTLEYRLNVLDPDNYDQTIRLTLTRLFVILATAGVFAYPTATVWQVDRATQTVMAPGTPPRQELVSLDAPTSFYSSSFDVLPAINLDTLAEQADVVQVNYNEPGLVGSLLANGRVVNFPAGRIYEVVGGSERTDGVEVFTQDVSRATTYNRTTDQWLFGLYTLGAPLGIDSITAQIEAKTLVYEPAEGDPPITPINPPILREDIYIEVRQVSTAPNRDEFALRIHANDSFTRTWPVRFYFTVDAGQVASDYQLTLLEMRDDNGGLYDAQFFDVTGPFLFPGTSAVYYFEMEVYWASNLGNPNVEHTYRFELIDQSDYDATHDHWVTQALTSTPTRNDYFPIYDRTDATVLWHGIEPSLGTQPLPPEFIYNGVRSGQAFTIEAIARYTEFEAIQVDAVYATLAVSQEFFAYRLLPLDEVQVIPTFLKGDFLGIHNRDDMELLDPFRNNFGGSISNNQTVNLDTPDPAVTWGNGHRMLASSVTERPTTEWPNATVVPVGTSLADAITALRGDIVLRHTVDGIVTPTLTITNIAYDAENILLTPNYSAANITYDGNTKGWYLFRLQASYGGQLIDGYHWVFVGSYEDWGYEPS